MDREDFPSDAGDEIVLPLRDRMPEYLAVFGVGGGAALAVGLVIGVLSSASVLSGMAYTVIMLGVVFLLAGGAAGGGYSNMGIGAVGTLFGGRTRPDDDYQNPDVRRGKVVRTDPRERLRRGLRPEANPRAFWQVIGGFAYIAVGIGMLTLFGP